MTNQQKPGKGGRRKIGRSARKPSHQRYNAQGRRDENKRKRIKRSNGLAFLDNWERELRTRKAK